MTTTQTAARNAATVRVTATADNRAIITVSDGLHTIEAHYWAPMGGGYVRETTTDRPGTLGSQVSRDGLYHAGHMLTWSGSGTLAAVIRGEVRRAAGRRHMLARLEDAREAAWWQTDEGRALAAEMDAEMDAEYDRA
jgi:hypothetical protein